MIFKPLNIPAFVQALLLFICAWLSVYGYFSHLYWLSGIAVLLSIILIINYYRHLQSSKREMLDFVSSTQHRDFTRYFDATQTTGDLRQLRQGFNDINNVFRTISREREMQLIHLKSILEIVDTGILSYEINDGSILWMNEALKALLQTPYLKTIHSLEKKNLELYQELQRLKPGQKSVINLVGDNGIYKILLSVTMFESNAKRYKLIAFQNINEELVNEETLAWQKLLRVMTHEIMNSVAPISSLAELLKNRLLEEQKQQPSELLSDLETGIETIQTRSDSLLKFAGTYRNLSKIQSISRQEVQVSDLFDHVQQLMLPTCQQRQVELDVVLHTPLLSIYADEALIQHVLINLILNALDALKDLPNGHIQLVAELKQHKPLIKVSDNGCGIPSEVLESIFVPFFSTKKNGTGIGLSLCKQIMLLHKAQMTVKSKPNEGTVFTLQFDNT